MSAPLLFELHAQALSSYYTKGNEWQETIALSIKFFHTEKNRIEKIIGNKDIIDFGEWYLSGPFPGKPEDLFKAKFGPEYNSGLKQEYIGGQKWTPHPEWIDGLPHWFEGEAAEVNYVQRFIQSSRDMEILAYVSSDDGLHFWMNDELIFKNDADRGLEPNQEYIPIKIKKGLNKVLIKINNLGGRQGFFFSLFPSEDIYMIEMEKIY